MDKLFSRKELQTRLRKLGLPAADPTLNKYERQGVIPKSLHRIKRRTDWRYYTEEELGKIINLIRKHVKERKHSNV